jgi:hypothetical protein
MNHPEQVQIDHERKMLAALYRALPNVGQEYRSQVGAQIGAGAGFNRNVANEDLRLFAELGIFSRRVEYGIPSRNGMQAGRHWHWTVLLAKEEAEQRLAVYQEQRLLDHAENRKSGIAKSAGTRRGQSHVNRSETLAVATDPTEETRAIAGPDAPTIGDLAPAAMKALRRDEIAALIEATRQYQNRHATILGKLDELATMAKEIGVTFSKERALESITLDTDERLEAIALVLPHIDRLDEMATRLTNQITAQSAKVRDYDKVVAENNRLKSRVEDLVSRRITAQQQPLAQ